MKDFHDKIDRETSKEDIMTERDKQVLNLITALDEIRDYGITGEDAVEMKKIADEALKTFELYVSNIVKQIKNSEQTTQEEKNIIHCPVKNVVEKTIKICCDSRKNECEHFCEIKQNKFIIGICTKVT